ncbi:MAG TPA: response regulator [Nitrospiraceae bacterium]|nr:response regulator [Nitrospiraceae bacterium]
MPPNDVVSAAQMHLLIVHEVEPLWLCEMLHSFGFLVQACRHGRDALDCLAQMKGFTGVLLDVHARSSDEKPLLPELRHRYPQMPIITMGGRKDIDRLRASIQLGAHEYLVTPIDGQVLKAKCAKVFFHQERVDGSQGLDLQNDQTTPEATS